jgi:hypothetical protein
MGRRFKSGPRYSTDGRFQFIFRNLGADVSPEWLPDLNWVVECHEVVENPG